MKNYPISDGFVQVINGPSKFDLILSLFDNKIVNLTTEDGKKVIKVQFKSYLASVLAGFREDHPNDYLVDILDDSGNFIERRLLMFDSKKRNGAFQACGESITISTHERKA